MTETRRRTNGWQLDRSCPEAYERYLVPGLFEPWAERLIERVDIREDETILDVACGTGIVARCVAPRLSANGTIVGLDVNEGMLAVAAATATEAGLAIEWRHGDVIEIPFSDEHFDVVFCQQALQFFEEPAMALEEMHRVLTPSGRFAVSVWRPLSFNPGYVVLADALERHVGDEAAAMMRSPFPAWEGADLRSLVRNAGFSEFSVTIEIGSMRYPSAEEFVRREAASSPLADRLAAIPKEVREHLVRDVGDELQSYTDDDGVVFPMESYVLTGNR